MLRVLLLLVPLMFFTAACGSDAALEIKPDDKPADKINAEAENAWDRRDYLSAAHLYDDLEREHPYSDLATNAQFMSGYSYYNIQKYDDAIMAFDRFVELHPGSDSVPQAYYLKALSYYEQISDVSRDQKVTKEAGDALKEVYERFPGTTYARDAKMKYDLTLDHMAGKEMAIGRYYLKRSEYVAAMNRFKNVVDNYQMTSHTPEALSRLVEVYTALNLKDEATRVAAILGHNFPDSKWYKNSYELLKNKQGK